MSDLNSKLDKFTQNLLKALKELQSPVFLNSVGELVVPMIQGRVRRGYSVERTDNDEKKFTSLSKSYMEQRAGKAIYFKQTTTQKILRIPKNKITEKYFKFKEQFNPSVASAKRSNLNQYGKLIDSLRFRLLSKKIEISHSGNHHKGMSNAELAKLHENGDLKLPSRPYLHLSSKELLKVRQLFEKKIGSAIRNLINK
jgi:hypothetical protein